MRLSACQVKVCQLSHVLSGARMTECGQYEHLATCRHGPSRSQCSLGAGVLGHTLYSLQPRLIRTDKIDVSVELNQPSVCVAAVFSTITDMMSVE